MCIFIFTINEVLSSIFSFINTILSNIGMSLISIHDGLLNYHVNTRMFKLFKMYTKKINKNKISPLTTSLILNKNPENNNKD